MTDPGPSDPVGGPDDGDSTTDRGGPGPSGPGTGTPGLDNPTDPAPPPPPADPVDSDPPPPPPPSPSPPVEGEAAAPVESEPAVSATTEPSKPATPWKLIAGLAVLAVALGIAAFLVGKANDSGDNKAKGTSSTTIATPANFVTVSDEEGGFTIKHPKSWKSVRDPAGDERLFVTAGDQNYLRVRVVSVDPSIDLRAGIETGFQEEGVRVIKKQDITLNGVPGLYYLYTFDDPSTEKQAVHAHYFLVRGEKMYVIVFQALPPDEFTRLAPVFDQVAETFQSTSDAPAPTPTSTPDSSAPDTTTAPASSSTTQP